MAIKRRFRAPDLRKARVLLRNSGGRAVSDVAGLGARMLIALILGRLAGARELGVLALATTVGGLAVLPALMGVDGWVSLRGAKESSAGGTDPGAEGLRVVGATAPATALMIGITGALMGGTAAIVCFGGAAIVLFTAPGLVLRAGFAGAGKLRLAGYGGIAEGVTACALGVGLVVAGLGAAGALTSLAAGRAANLVVSALLYRRHVGPLRTHGHARARMFILKESRYFALMRPLVTGFQRADALLMGALLGTAAVGFYGAATNLTLSVPILALAMAEAMLPRVYGTDERDAGRAAAFLISMLAVLGVVIGAVLIVSAPMVVRLLYGAGYDASVTLLRVLVLAIPLVFVDIALATAVIGRGFQRERVIAQALGLSSNLLADVIFIPLLGVVGAAWGTVISEVVYVSALGWIAMRNGLIPWHTIRVKRLVTALRPATS